MHVDDLMFAEREGIPNNPHLPVLVYHDAVDVSGDGATRIEDRFHANGWRGVWRDGVFDFQHYHTRAHEVLAVARGKARLLIGGPTGKELEIMAGDVLVLPAGTGHCRIAASADFLVIGGYPPGQHADIQRGPASNSDRQAIASVPLPQLDPVFGSDGPVMTLWQRATR
ncbi:MULTISPECIES: cupin domain-containing protein [unclassified Sinorhizobium]|uniref:cupin domain-containing protein n=1 Tax=unclassified Sinorhizobium TaxID=2613772 RepID=UPI0024C460A0|nr:MULTISPECIES: cupin domain-containing protein [unclassified Sinorhizobium]MDK1374366.1 cupin domain-containing protein [Sinorhizobium sp. 6-70]MDK1478981.1 cupin domain-containing protein [Sinorhizobium sp. 6-117]